MEHLKLDTNERDLIDGEEPTLYHLLQTTKRREARMIRQIQDQRGRITDDWSEIPQSFLMHMRNKYGHIEGMDDCVADMVGTIRPTARTEHGAYLEQPITSEELFTALKSGGRNKVNTTVTDSTGFTSVELLFEARKPGLFEKILKKSPENLPEPETIGDKVMKAYARMRKKASERRERRKMGNKTWEPEVKEKVLVKSQTVSDAAVGVTANFIHPYEGPYIISRVISPSTYELSTTSGKVRGAFNKKYLKPYLEEETSNAAGSN